MDEPTAFMLEQDSRPSRQAVVARGGATPDGRCVDVSVIMPTIFWSGTFERCARQVLRMIDDPAVRTEVIFVFDGAAPPVPAWLDRPGVRILKVASRSGPAAARNRAAEAARGEVLLFVDSDVELADDVVSRVRSAFAVDADLVGLFGAYDDEPAVTGVASLFRNLLHHHTHVTHAGRAFTFWSGCGAMRRKAFLDVGGFDEHFSYPSVEDIELGMRVAAHGGRILLAPDVRCKHLKYWTLASMVHTDIVHRAIPWTRLIVTNRELPASLNLDWRSRFSGACSVLVAAFMIGSALEPMLLWAALLCGLVVIALNSDFYELCRRKYGVGFAIKAVGLHWLYFVYSSLTFGIVTLWTLLSGWRRSAAPSACTPSDRPAHVSS